MGVDLIIVVFVVKLGVGNKEKGLVHYGLDAVQMGAGIGFAVMFCRGGFVFGVAGLIADKIFWDSRHTKAEMPATR